MYKCDVCGSTEASLEYVSEVFELEGKQVLVEQIPATVCKRCGDASFSRETTERIRRILHGEGHPNRKIEMDVFAFA